jgi:hypothetical protein
LKLLDIWTQCAGKFKNNLKDLLPWRVIEGQHFTSTRKLVDSLEEQKILEEMIDSVKPKLDPQIEKLHYLLSTPFRHPPLRNGSRFGTRLERSIFYASEEPETAFSETAYYRLFFLNAMEGDPGLVTLDHTLFQAKAHADHFVDLTQDPFIPFQSIISSPSSYETTQKLGLLMREHQIDAFLFRSARDPNHGNNIGIFNPTCFTLNKPTYYESWKSFSTKQKVELVRNDGVIHENFVFDRNCFLISDSFPEPSVH